MKEEARCGPILARDETFALDTGAGDPAVADEMFVLRRHQKRREILQAKG